MPIVCRSHRVSPNLSFAAQFLEYVSELCASLHFCGSDVIVKGSLQICSTWPMEFQLVSLLLS